MNVRHEAWLWAWFIVGMGTYWLKRAYYLVTGPNPVANTYGQFWQRCWIPLLVRGFLESLIFWVMFDSQIADKALTALGWTSYDWAVKMVTSIAPIAALFGHTMDSLMDMAISKVPFINTILPQMPGPIKPCPPEPPVAGPVPATPPPTPGA